MNHYLVFNHSDEKFLVGTFTENIFLLRRELIVELNVENPTEGDAMVSSLSTFLAENSVSHIDLVNENNESLYSTSRYDKIDTFSIVLSLGEEESAMAPRMVYNVHFACDI